MAAYRLAGTLAEAFEAVRESITAAIGRNVRLCVGGGRALALSESLSAIVGIGNSPSRDSVVMRIHSKGGEKGGKLRCRSRNRGVARSPKNGYASPGVLSVDPWVRKSPLLNPPHAKLLPMVQFHRGGDGPWRARAVGPGSSCTRWSRTPDP